MIIQYSLDVDYSCKEMFTLVADYQSYPQFVKNCTGAQTFKAEENQVLAELSMSFTSIKQKFSTYTTFYPHQKITMELAEGPFKKLHGYWAFHPREEGKSTIELYMDYELNPVLEMLLGRKFQNSMKDMVDCFIKRADTIYGKKEVA